MRPRVALLQVAILLLSTFFAAPLARSSVLISELCDPRDNYLTDRFLEIYNAGPDAVDLTNWTLVAVANNVDAYTWHLSGSINPGQALVAGNATTVATFTVDFPGAWSTANANWNGKIGDGARLVDASGTATDIVVATGTLFENADLVRKPVVTQPNPIYTPAEWTSTAVTLAIDASPGSHGGAPPSSGPVISGQVTEPAVPLATDTVHVRANVVDTTATIATVTLLWGTATGSLTNSIPMTLLSGSTYVTTAAVPAQSEGTTVYYQVQATSSTPVTTTSSISTYFLSYAITIHQIQGEVTASPYAGLGVITRGVVTARLGTCFVIQDGAGAWSGLWVRSSATPAVGDSIAVRGQITESDAQGLAGNTLLASAVISGTWPGGVVPPPAVITDAVAGSEAYEGVLVTVAEAACTNTNLGEGVWQVEDGSGPLHVDPTGYAFAPTLGTTYGITGPIGFTSGQFRINPRAAGDVVLVADHSAPVILAVAEMGDSTFLVSFSEPVELTSAQTAGNYSIAGMVASAAIRDSLNASQVWLTVAGVPAASVTLTATGIADLYANATAGATWMFPYIDARIPPGYYDSALGLRGTQLRAALHDIIKNHTVVSYDGAWTAYRTTDRKPDGKVWDVYSDIPGGTAPYEYTFEQTGGVGGQEGTGYTREHTWCKNWFGGAVSSMYSDLWIIYPCDTHVNGTRGVNPYGDVAVPTFTSLNGSMVGSSADAGYTGSVFEPIDAFKGDLARSYFYVSTRYYTEDGAWPGGPAFDGADLLPWANETYVRWSYADPVSQKEILRNGAVYALQHNRNPFVDHPEFVALLFDSLSNAAVGDESAVSFALRQVAPNPFHARTTIRFDLARRSPVQLQVFDVAGRLVRTLVSGAVMDPGRHEAVWDGRGEGGRAAGAGLYFCRLMAGTFVASRRMVLVQ
jgi:endonuclease I